MERVRDKSTSRTAVFSRTERRKDGTGPVDTPPDAVISWLDYDRMHDFVTPRFKRRSKAGEIVNNPMRRVTSSFAASPSAASDSGPKRIRNYSSYIQWVPDAEELLALKLITEKVARVEALVITEAYSEVNRADVTSLVELAEMRETLAFLSSPVRGMVRLTQRASSWLKSANRREARHAERVARYKANLEKWQSRPPHRRGRAPTNPGKVVHPPFTVGKFTARDIPSLWLAYRYGIMPLIYSFQDVQKALGRSLEAPFRATARAKADEDVSAEVDWYPPAVGAGVADGRFNVRYIADITAKVTSRAGVLYAPDFSFNATWGLQMNRVPAAVYELIPLSFVADWFWTGSKAYDALTAQLRAKKILSSWVTTTVEIRAPCRDVWTPANGESASQPPVRAFGVQTVTLKRRRPASLADVRVQMVIDLNAKRIADGLSLVYLFLSGRRR